MDKNHSDWSKKKKKNIFSHSLLHLEWETKQLLKIPRQDQNIKYLLTYVNIFYTFWLKMAHSAFREVKEE